MITGASFASVSINNANQTWLRVVVGVERVVSINTFHHQMHDLEDFATLSDGIM